MEVTCWNCKTKTALDKPAVETAIKQMDGAKLDIFDVPCASCGKANRTKREEFTKALEVMSAPQVSQREQTKQTKEDNAKRRGDDDKGAMKKTVEKLKKARR